MSTVAVLFTILIVGPAQRLDDSASLDGGIETSTGTVMLAVLDIGKLVSLSVFSYLIFHFLEGGSYEIPMSNNQR